ncbi:MAG: hypothetical protein PHC97_04550 [Patescibacteria group bacterium]|nr:hypothetical protein [Patescibacteria group bacterium]
MVKEVFAPIPDTADKGIESGKIKKTLTLVERGYKKGNNVETDKNKLRVLIFDNLKVGDYVAFPVETKVDKNVTEITGSKTTGEIKLGKVQGIDAEHKQAFVEGIKLADPEKIMNITWLFERNGWKNLPEMMPYDEFEKFKSELEEIIKEKKQEREAQTAEKSSAAKRAFVEHPEKNYPFKIGDVVDFKDETSGEVITGRVAGFSPRGREGTEIIIKINATKGNKQDNYVVKYKDILKSY